MKKNILGYSSRQINHAVYLETLDIRNNLGKKDSNLGVTANIPNFEAHLRNFIEGTLFPIIEFLIEYTSSWLYGRNILILNGTLYIGRNFSISNTYM